MYDLGIIGGMGPEATAEIFKRIITLTDANCDQEHMKICILNKPQIPDRTEYIIGRGQSPLPVIMEGISELKTLGARYFIIPCNTSHIFANLFSKQKDIKFIDMIETTKRYLSKKYRGKKICILGTTGTVTSKIYGDGCNDGIHIFYPEQDIQDEVMSIIISVKANNKSISDNKTRIINVMKEINKSQGNCIFVVACTELSVIVSGQYIDGIEYIDAMEILAINAIINCGYKINRRMTNLDILTIMEDC